MNVGDYVRTDKGNISKIKWISQQVINSKETKAGTFHLENGEIVHMYYGDTIKSSPQIIDLIEVGDYVNGLPVIRIYNENEKYDNSNYKFSMKVVEVKNDNYETIPFEDIFKNEEIKTILTHEQFESEAYRVEE